MSAEAQRVEVAWEGAATPLIVVCIDLHDSMANRRTIEPLQRSAEFLRHNSIVHESCQLWKQRNQQNANQMELVNFVGDAALVTFPEPSREQALAFAWEIIDKIHDSGSETAIGIDVGDVAIIGVASGHPAHAFHSRQAAGFAVDRAVRLSWIARPGEILATDVFTSTLGVTTEFQLMPTVGPVAVSLDKWPSGQLELGGEVFVHSVRRIEIGDSPSYRPANVRILSDYFRRLQLASLDFLRESPRKWSLVLEEFRKPERWTRREALEDFLETLMASRKIDGMAIPELDGFRSSLNGDPIIAFREWRDGMIASVQNLLARYHDLTLAQVNNIDFLETMDRAVSELVIYSRAGLRKLEMSA